MKFRSVNPTTGKLLKSFSFVADSEIDGLVSKVHQRYKYNLLKGDAGITERLEKLQSLAGVLEKGKKDYAELMTVEMGKPIAQAEGEVAKCFGHLRYYAENGSQFMQNKMIETEAHKSYVRY